VEANSDDRYGPLTIARSTSKRSVGKVSAVGQKRTFVARSVACNRSGKSVGDMLEGWLDL